MNDAILDNDEVLEDDVEIDHDPDVCDCGECEECIKKYGECTCGDCDVCKKREAEEGIDMEDLYDDIEPEDMI